MNASVKGLFESGALFGEKEFHCKLELPFGPEFWLLYIPVCCQPVIHGQFAMPDEPADTPADGYRPLVVASRFPVCGDDRRGVEIPAFFRASIVFSFLVGGDEGMYLYVAQIRDNTALYIRYNVLCIYRLSGNFRR